MQLNSRWVQMGRVKILWAIISVVPFYFITLQQSSAAFLQSSEALPDQPRLLPAHMRGFYRSICIFLFYVRLCLIGFRACRLAAAVLSQFTCKVSCYGCDDAVIAGPKSGSPLCKPASDILQNYQHIKESL